MEAIVQVDKEGRINLPIAILEELRFPHPGPLKAEVTGGKLEITAIRKPAGVTFVNENGALVAVNAEPFDAVAVVDAVRNERR
jgi:hypothetical protein